MRIASILLLLLFESNHGCRESYSASERMTLIFMKFLELVVPEQDSPRPLQRLPSPLPIRRTKRQPQDLLTLKINSVLLQPLAITPRKNICATEAKEITEVLKNGAVSEYMQQKEGFSQSPRRVLVPPRTPCRHPPATPSWLTPIKLGGTAELGRYYIAHTLFRPSNCPSRRSPKRPLRESAQSRAATRSLNEPLEVRTRNLCVS